MKRLKSTLVGSIVIGLEAGSAVAVAAQDSDSGVTFVSGSMIETVEAARGEFIEENGVGHLVADRNEQTIEWTDPRLLSRRVVSSNADIYQPSEPGAVPFSSTVLLEGDDGSWTGTAVGYFEGGFGDFVGRNVLVGHGAYDGLTASLYESYSEGPGSPMAWEGIIFEGEMPPMPDALSAE